MMRQIIYLLLVLLVVVTACQNVSNSEPIIETDMPTTDSETDIDSHINGNIIAETDFVEIGEMI
jgi:hypothetical protein